MRETEGFGAKDRRLYSFLRLLYYVRIGGCMSAGIGAETAHKVKKMWEAEAVWTAQRDRDERVLSSECVPFFEAVAILLKENVASFNFELGLEGNNELTFVSHPGLIELGKRTNPTLLRKVVHLQPSQEVIIRTDTSIYYRVGVKQEKWRFNVEHGELLLNGRNVLECADALFDGIAESFR
ncbi:MAG: hypothetical protein WCA89_13840 [Terracidiphilus sp.]